MAPLKQRFKPADMVGVFVRDYNGAYIAYINIIAVERCFEAAETEPAINKQRGLSPCDIYCIALAGA